MRADSTAPVLMAMFAVTLLTAFSARAADYVITDYTQNDYFDLPVSEWDSDTTGWERSKELRAIAAAHFWDATADSGGVPNIYYTDFYNNPIEDSFPYMVCVRMWQGISDTWRLFQGLNGLTLNDGDTAVMKFKVRHDPWVESSTMDVEVCLQTRSGQDIVEYGNAYYDLSSLGMEWQTLEFSYTHSGDPLVDPEIAFKFINPDPNVPVHRLLGLDTLGMNVDPPADCDVPDPEWYDPQVGPGPEFTWEMPRDFPPQIWEDAPGAVNPYRDWSFGEGDSLGEFNLFLDKNIVTSEFDYYYVTWTNDPNDPDRANAHKIFDAMGGPSYDQSCVVGLHPSTAASPYTNAMIRWTSPIDATVGVVGEFGAGGAGSVDCWVYKSTGEVLFEALDISTDTPFAFLTDVNVGTTIDFVVGPGGSYGDENTSLTISIGESLTSTCLTYLPLDLNHDCYVNIGDFAIFAAEWLNCNDLMNPNCTP